VTRWAGEKIDPKCGPTRFCPTESGGKVAKIWAISIIKTDRSKQSLNSLKFRQAFDCNFSYMYRRRELGT
jgi:hypothetical protein